MRFGTCTCTSTCIYMYICIKSLYTQQSPWLIKFKMYIHELQHMHVHVYMYIRQTNVHVYTCTCMGTEWCFTTRAPQVANSL